MVQTVGIFLYLALTEYYSSLQLSTYEKNILYRNDFIFRNQLRTEAIHHKDD